jgi:integrase
MARDDLETRVDLEKRWHELTVPEEKLEQVFWHNAGANKGHTALAMKLRRRTGGKEPGRSWLFEYRKAGKASPQRITCPIKGADYQAAHRWRLKQLVVLSQGIDPVEEAAQRAAQEAEEKEAAEKAARQEAQRAQEANKTVGELLDQYVTERLSPTSKHRKGKRRGKPLKAGYVRQAVQRLQPIRTAWGDRPAREIDVPDIRSLLNDYLDRSAALEALENALFAFLGWAVEQKCLLIHPWPNYEFRGVSGINKKFLNDEELKLLLPALKVMGYPIGSLLHLALLTGRRKTELTDAEWKEFDLERGLWVLPGSRAKNWQTHTLPLSPTALALLREAEKHKAGFGRYVFHRKGVDAPVKNLSAELAKLRAVTKPATDRRMEEEQRAPWAAHSLRKTARTILGSLKEGNVRCPRDVAHLIMNHALDNGEMDDHYNFADALPEMRDWLIRLDRYYAELAPVLLLPAPAAALPAPAIDELTGAA